MASDRKHYQRKARRELPRPAPAYAPVDPDSTLGRALEEARKRAEEDRNA